MGQSLQIGAELLQIRAGITNWGNYYKSVQNNFNVKSSNWYNKDKTNFEGNTIENVTSQLGLHQIINEPKHILSNSSSCIDLIFTSQPNMVIESGVHSSLYSSCHHQIVFAKFNLEICYPPQYSREVWYFREAKTDLIRRALNDFIWERAFSNTNVKEKVCIFNKSVLNVLSNFIHTNPYYAMIRIPHGLTLGLSLFYMPKIKFAKMIERTKPIFNYLIN